MSFNAYAHWRKQVFIMSTKNIKYQFLYAINQNFKENQDKHSLKKEHLTEQATIFSYSARSNLIDVSSCFANWLKNSHHEIKKVKDITSMHIGEFLSIKAESCSQNTLTNYKSLFQKLSSVVNSTYHINTNYTKDLILPTSCKNGGGKIRCQLLESVDYNTLLKTTNTNLKKAILLSQNFGLRASEISKLKVADITADCIHIINSKGKRSRTIPIQTLAQKQSLLDVYSLIDNDRICPVQHESLQQAFRRELKRTGLDSKYKNGCFHLCRKAYATNQYRECRSTGLTVKESMQKVSVLLGHGMNRFELMKQYICCSLT